MTDQEVREKVEQVISRIREEGNQAVREYTEMFDNVRMENFEVSEKRKTEAVESLNKQELKAIEESIIRIRNFHNSQKPESWEKEFSEGFKAGEKVVPIENVGCYVPGGNYALPSSALMTLLPADIAGVKEKIVVTPPGKNGKANRYTIAAAELAGADKIFKIGGIQGIAAMAYGVGEVPEVDKVVGPGNKWVTEAKKELYGEVGIDLLAGPSELLIISDGHNRPEILASDLLAQAEHDKDAKVYLFSTSKEEIQRTKVEIREQLKDLETKRTASKSIDKLEARNFERLEKAVESANQVAPEHLELQVSKPLKLLKDVKNAGTVFLGSKSAEALGDYTTGTNHVLPTGGSSKFTGGLNVRDFVKYISWEQQSDESFKEIKDAAITMSKIESLPGHKKSIEKRGDKQ